MQRVTLPSNSSMDVYPDNTLSNFSVKLPKSLSVDNYECGLEEIIMPTQLHNVRSGFNKVAVVLKQDDGSWKQSEVFVIPPSHYSKAEDLAEAIRKAGVRGNEAITLRIVNGLTVVNAKTPYGLIFDGDIASILGFPVAEDHALVEGLATSALPASPTNSLTNLYVYTSIIKDQLVGGTMAPLLRVINVVDSSLYTSRTFTTPHFAPLSNSHFDTISIQIRDDSGELVHFSYGKVIVVLLFRPI